MSFFAYAIFIIMNNRRNIIVKLRKENIKIYIESKKKYLEVFLPAIGI
jgi:hypothetical protein